MAKKSLLWIVGAVVIVLALFMIFTYNGLVGKQEFVNRQWSEVQNNYQRRLDLVPNLVNVVKGGAEYESTTLQQVAKARAAMTSGTVSARDVQNQTNAQNEVAGTVNSMLLARVERYPELKGTQAFRDLQVQLEGTERRIKISRKDFNAAVMDYNQTVRSFPQSLVAGITGFNRMDGFEAAAGSDKAVEIKF